MNCLLREPYLLCASARRALEDLNQRGAMLGEDPFHLARFTGGSPPIGALPKGTLSRAESGAQDLPIRRGVAFARSIDDLLDRQRTARVVTQRERCPDLARRASLIR